MAQSDLRRMIPSRGRVTSVVVIVVGADIALLMLAADYLGLGAPGFGWRQLLGLIVGIAITTAGVTLYRAGGSPGGAWQRWRRLAAVVATWQARVLYSIVYVVLVIPIGPILRWTSDPLHLRRPSGGRTADGTTWHERPTPASPPTWSRSQF